MLLQSQRHNGSSLRHSSRLDITSAALIYCESRSRAFVVMVALVGRHHSSRLRLSSLLKFWVGMDLLVGYSSSEEEPSAPITGPSAPRVVLPDVNSLFAQPGRQGAEQASRKRPAATPTVFQPGGTKGAWPVRTALRAG